MSSSAPLYGHILGNIQGDFYAVQCTNLPYFFKHNYASQNAGFTVEPLRPEKVDDQEHRMLAALAGQKRDVIRIMLFALPLLLLSMGHMWGMPLPRTLDPAHAPGIFALAQLLLTMPVVWSGRQFYVRGFPALIRQTQ